MRYSGDGMYVCRPYERNLGVVSIDELGNRSSIISRKILEAICAGGKIVTKDYVIDDSNRKAFYELFMAMYRTERKYLDERRKDGISKLFALTHSDKENISAPEARHCREVLLTVKLFYQKFRIFRW